MPLQRNILGKRTIESDTRQLRARLNLQAATAGGSTDHGLLLGLGDDDHTQYLHLTGARSIVAQHTFAPSTPQAPFLLSANAQSQLVGGLRADELSKAVNVSGLGLSGGGAMTADRTITLTSSSNPGAAAAILASDINGFLELRRLSLGTLGEAQLPLHIQFTTEQARFQYDTSNYFRVTVASDGDSTLSTVGTNASLILAPAGDLVLGPTGDDVFPDVTDTINLGGIQKKYLTLHASELWVTTLVAAEVLATIGGQIIVAPTTELKADLSSTALLLNPGFESRTGNDFDNWDETIGSAPGAVEADTTTEYEGTTALKMTQSGTLTTQVLSDSITVTAETEYILHFWRKIDSGDGAVRVTVYDDSNSQFIHQDVDMGGTASWAQNWLSFATPTNCVSIHIRLKPAATSGDVAYFDGMWLNEAQITTKHNSFRLSERVVMRSAGKLEWFGFGAWNVDTVVHGSDYLELPTSYGDLTGLFVDATTLFQIRDSTANDGTYRVSSTTFTGGKTRITIDNTYSILTDSTGDGHLAYTMTSLNGPYTYPRCTRNMDRTGMNDWYIGDAMVSTGNAAGDGFIDLYSVSGIEYGAGPSIVGSVRTATTLYSDIEERWAVGNLNGLYGYASDEYGIAAGDPAGSRITIDPTNGIKMYNSASVATLTLPSTGNAQIVGTLEVTSPGTITAGGGDVVIDSDGITVDGGALGTNQYKFGNISGSGYWTVSESGDDIQSTFTTIAAAGASQTSIMRFESVATGTDTAQLGLWARETASDYAFIYPSLMVGLVDEAPSGDMTFGITIDQGTADDEIIALKSSDVNHQVSDQVETDTYGMFKKYTGANGGLQIRGLGNSTVGLYLYGTSNGEDTTTSTAAVGAVFLRSTKRLNNTTTAITNAGNLVVMRSGGNTRWILKADGEVHNDYATAMTLYDDHDDIKLLRAFDLKSSALSIADNWFSKNVSKLEELGIVSDVRPDGMFVSQNKMTKLQIGAIWQLYQRIEKLERRLFNGRHEN